jgi:uncharacterized protein
MKLPMTTTMPAALLILSSTLMTLSAQPDTLSLKAIPTRMEWINRPAAAKVLGPAELEITAGKNTDRFFSPVDSVIRASSPWLVFDQTGDFALRAKVTVDFHSKWDAGALVIYLDDQYWAKLCFEYSTAGKPTIVSVVTRGLSDDANAFNVEGNTAWLQIARVGPAIFFYSSTDGKSWQVIRNFTLGIPEVAMSKKLKVGFSSQSPAGDGCRSLFSEIKHRPTRLPDMWTGEWDKP